MPSITFSTVVLMSFTISEITFLTGASATLTEVFISANFSVTAVFTEVNFSAILLFIPFAASPIDDNFSPTASLIPVNFSLIFVFIPLNALIHYRFQSTFII